MSSIEPMKKRKDEDEENVVMCVVKYKQLIWVGLTHTTITLDKGADRRRKRESERRQMGK